MLFACETSSLTQALGGPMSIRDYATYLKSAAVSVAFAVSAVGVASAADLYAKAPPPAPTSFFFVNDNSVSFTWFPGATNPGITDDTYNNRFQFDMTHFDVNKWGTNFIDMNYQQYGKKDPIQSMAGAEGAHEMDFLVRNTLSGNAFLGKGFFSNSITKDISLGYGGFWNALDTFLAPAAQQYDIGVVFGLNLPGTVNFAAYAQKENHHITQDAICPGFSGALGLYTPFIGIPGQGNFCAFTGDQSYKWAPRLELVTIEPLTFLPWPVSWNSFTGVTFPKGTGLSQANVTALLAAGGWCVTGGNNPNNPCSAETKTEVFSENRIVLDVGKLAWSAPGIWEVYAGYRYWYNKFGTDHNAGLFSFVAPNTSIESTAFLGTTYHFK
jgi:hypothetical protein